MLLGGTGVFVYGVFETVRFSTMGYLNGQWTVHTEQEEKLSDRLRSSWRNMVKTNAVINLVGIMVATCLLFFSLWQLDLIVSGPVWWQASLMAPDGAGLDQARTQKITSNASYGKPPLDKHTTPCLCWSLFRS